MTNHFHPILINGDYNIGAGNGHDHSLRMDGTNHHQRQTIKPVPELIGAFKTTTSKLIHQSGFPDLKWQKSYYEHIIRNTDALHRIRQYIVDNSIQWELDMENINSTEHQINHYYKILTKV